MSSKDDQRILSKLKYLRQEDKALQDIETKLRAQLNRLKQEERVLRQQMRQSSGEAYAEAAAARARIEEEYGVQQDVDDTELMNKKPLMDLNDAATSILQMCQAQFVGGQYVAEEEEEEEDEEDEEGEEEEEEEGEQEGDGEFGTGGHDIHRGSIEQEVGDELGAAYQKLFKEMQAEMDYDDDDEFDDT
ncbi:uncharacterized protein [Diadema setosum]|uniref:uncharacterized protein n=1 Tax=Diadema setosum TaxID=31175 RepID=UPI003B3B8326